MDNLRRRKHRKIIIEDDDMTPLEIAVFTVVCAALIAIIIYFWPFDPT